MFNKKENSWLEKIPAKSAFWLGFFGGIGIILAIGFIIMLVLFLLGIAGNEDIAANAGNKVVNNQPAAAANNNAAGDQPAEINLKPITKDDWMKGDINAPITIVEYSDLECPFCKRFHPVLQQIIDNYGSEVNWVYRHFPLTTLHSKAAKEAEATECAGALGGNEAFWKFTDRLYEITPANNGFDLAQLPEIAAYIGLDKDEFSECLDSGKYAQAVQQDGQDAVNAGGRGTPYSVILVEDQKIPVSGAATYEQVESIIKTYLQ